MLDDLLVALAPFEAAGSPDATTVESTAGADGVLSSWSHEGVLGSAIVSKVDFYFFRMDRDNSVPLFRQLIRLEATASSKA